MHICVSAAGGYSPPSLGSQCAPVGCQRHLELLLSLTCAELDSLPADTTPQIAEERARLTQEQNDVHVQVRTAPGADAELALCDGI